MLGIFQIWKDHYILELDKKKRQIWPKDHSCNIELSWRMGETNMKVEGQKLNMGKVDEPMIPHTLK